MRSLVQRAEATVPPFGIHEGWAAAPPEKPFQFPVPGRCLGQPPLVLAGKVCRSGSWCLIGDHGIPLWAGRLGFQRIPLCEPCQSPRKVFFSPWVSGGAPARVTARVPLASGLSRALRSLVPGSQRSPPRSVKCWQKCWDVWGLALTQMVPKAVISWRACVQL